MLLAGSGGSIPIVSALAQALPDAEALLVGTTDGFANIHGPNERLLLSEFENATRRRGRLPRPLRGGVGGAMSDAAAAHVDGTGGFGETEGGFAQRALAWIEKAGNRVPNPAILFLGMCVGVIVLSQILDWIERQRHERGRRRTTRRSTTASTA